MYLWCYITLFYLFSQLFCVTSFSQNVQNENPFTQVTFGICVFDVINESGPALQHLAVFYIKRNIDKLGPFTYCFSLLLFFHFTPFFSLSSPFFLLCVSLSAAANLQTLQSRWTVELKWQHLENVSNSPGLISNLSCSFSYTDKTKKRTRVELWDAVFTWLPC